MLRIFESFATVKTECFYIPEKSNDFSAAVKNMPQDFKNKYPEIPLETIANIRNTLESGNCDLEIVWETVKSEIPVLKTEILKINEVKITY